MDDRDGRSPAAAGGAEPVPEPEPVPVLEPEPEPVPVPAPVPVPEPVPAVPDEDVSVLFDLAFVQSRTGWRFGIDALLLARHLATGPAALPPSARDARLLEIGTGCGVVAVLAARWGFPGAIVAVERQPALADRARRNVAAAGLSDRVRVLHADAAALPDDGMRFERIASNPPFHRRGSGRVNPDPERRDARHESTLDMEGLFALAAARLAPGGLASFLYPAARCDQAVAAARRAGLSVAGITPCAHGPDAAPRVVIIDACHAWEGPPVRHPVASMDRADFRVPETC